MHGPVAVANGTHLALRSAAIRDAEEINAKAAAESREVAKALREDAGLSVTDAAVVMGVSRGRISQLTH